jgi:GntR family transcriptional regulator
MIIFRLQPQSGVAPYRQIVDQVKQALRLRRLEVGDQLPTVKEVVGMVAVNPNTVFKAYRELELEGLVEGRPGLGTFVVRTLGAPPRDYVRVRNALERWLREARVAGLDEEAIASLFSTTLRESASEWEVA